MIRHLLIACFVLICGLQPALSAVASPLGDEAAKAYKAKHYKEAISKYEELLKQGFVSPALHYNLGNAYYRNNQLGLAIYHYELALKLNPSDEDARTNLDIANSKTIDKIDVHTNYFAQVLKTRLVHSFTTTQWAWLSIVSLLVGLGLVFGFISSARPGIRKLCFFTGALLFGLFAAAMVLGYVGLKDKQQIQFAIITARESKIYNEPQEGEKMKYNLHEGTRVKVLETTPEWTSIKLENGNEGWVKTEELGLF